MLDGQLMGNRLVFLVPQRAERVPLGLVRLLGQGLESLRILLADLLDPLLLRVTQIEPGDGFLPPRFPRFACRRRG